MTILGLTEPSGSFRVTFCAITEESAECGDCADRGYLDSWGSPVDDALASDWSLQDLLDKFRGYSIYGDGDSTPSWITVSPESEYFLSSWWQAIGGPDGIAADCSVHRPDWITASSWRRVCRLLGWRG